MTHSLLLVFLTDILFASTVGLIHVDRESRGNWKSAEKRIIIVIIQE